MANMDTSWILIVVALTATGFLLQGIALLLIASRIKEAVTRGQKVLDDLARRVNQLALQASALLESLKPLGAAAKTVGGTLEEIGQTVRRRADDVDTFVQEVTDTLKSQASKLDFAVTDTLQKFEQVTTTIQREVLAPALEIASVIKGVRTGLDYLFSRKKEKDLRPATQDEEMFI